MSGAVFSEGYLRFVRDCVPVCVCNKFLGLWLVDVIEVIEEVELNKGNLSSAAGKQTNMKGGAESCATLGLKLN